MMVPASSQRRIRVLVNGLHAKSGGGISYVRYLLPELAKHPELELHLALHESQADLVGPHWDGIRVHLFRFRANVITLLLWEQLVLPMMARIMGADVIFSTANYGPLIPGTCHVVLLRNSLAVLGIARGLKQRLYWVALAGVTFLSLLVSRRAIAVSDYAADNLTLGLRRHFKGRIRRIFHGVAEIFRNDFLEPAAAVGEEPMLLAVSDIYVQKNLHTLIEALPAVVVHYPKLRLVIAGREIDGVYSARVRGLVDRLGLACNVHFLGSVPSSQLVDLYRTATLFVFPSQVETFGNPLVEAMASGCAIVSADTAAMPEVLGDAGIYFSPSDVSGLADRILKLLGDDALRAECQQRARARAANFSWTATAKATAEVLCEAAAGRRPRSPL